MAGKTLKTLILLSMIALATGCSDDGPTAPAANIDTAPPAVPANLAASYEDDVVTINWDANTVDADLAGYVVERDYRGDVTRLTPSPIQVASYEDPNPRPGTNTYYVYAVDNAGNESAVASAIVNLPSAHRTAELHRD